MKLLLPRFELIKSNLSQRLPQVSLTNWALEWVLGDVATQQRIRSRLVVRFVSSGPVVVLSSPAVVVVSTLVSWKKSKSSTFWMNSIKPDCLMMVRVSTWWSGMEMTINWAAKMPNTKPTKSPLKVANTKFRWNIFTTLLVFVIIGGKTKQQIITAGYSVGNCWNHQLEIFFPAPSLYSKSRLSFFLILTTARLPVHMPRPTFSHRKKRVWHYWGEIPPSGQVPCRLAAKANCSK